MRFDVRTYRVPDVDGAEAVVEIAVSEAATGVEVVESAWVTGADDWLSTVELTATWFTA